MYFPQLLTFFFYSFFLFLLGIASIFLYKKNLILILMLLEIVLFSINLNFIFFSLYLDDLMGQIFALTVLAVAAAESAIGLALLVVYYRLRGIITFANAAFVVKK